MIGWSQDYGSWFYTCVYGCHETDFEGLREAQHAFLTHTCTSVADPV